MNRTDLTPRKVALGVLFAAVAVVLLYLALPRLAGLDETWERIEQGDPWWLAGALLLELASFGGYVILFRGVFLDEDDPETARIGWRASYQITMAGVAATRLFAAAGAGGIALTAWALSRAGMEARRVVERMTTFMALLYVVFALSLVLGGVGLRTGVLSGPAPFGFTVVPAIFAGAAILICLTLTLVPGDLERRARTSRWLKRAAAVPANVASGVRGAIGFVWRRDPSALGAVAWWGFDIAVLWACFHAFGEPPPWSVLVMAYFTGQLANVLPLPGGIGAVEGGMIGALIAFGVDDGLAIVAVLAYRGFAFWLPTVPGLIAYLQLRRTVRDWEPAAERG